ncbi:hypothetical protein DYB35_013663, partial [Aphanomyces astaci]
METCSVCGANEGPTLRQCNMCSSKFHHMCIVEEAVKNGWPEAEEGQELCALDALSSSAQDVPPPAKKKGCPKGTKNKVSGFRRLLRETQIHKNNNKLLAFYADCMRSGVATEVRYVVGSENDPDFDTPGKNTKAEARRWWYCVEQFATLKANQRMNAGRSYLQISLFKPEDESHDLTEWDKKFLANSSFDEETKSDEETNDDSLVPQDDDGSGDEWSEYVDRGWKKHGHYDATEDIKGLEDVEWTCGGHYAGPTDLYEHEDNKDDTPVDELRISEEFKHLFKDPVKDFLAFMPLEFWKTVTLGTNAKAVALQAAHPKGYVGGREFKKSIELVEVMKFVGLL